MLIITSLVAFRTSVSDTEASFFGFIFIYIGCFVTTKIFDKRDDFDFDIVNFPFGQFFFLSLLFSFSHSLGDGPL